MQRLGAGSRTIVSGRANGWADPVSAGAFDELVVQLKQSLGLTVVMVTHDLDTLWSATDRVAFWASSGSSVMRRCGSDQPNTR